MSSRCKELPIEDTIWLIDLTSTKDDNGDEIPILTIHDRDRRTIGSQIVKDVHPEEILAMQSYDLVQTCCLSPLVGKPRRPKCVSFINSPLTGDAARLDLSELGIRYLCAGQVQAVEGNQVTMRECCVCRTRGSRDLFDTCGGCQAMLYCSPACQEADWSREGMMQGHSHKVWCKTMQEYMAKTDQLRELPFTFVQETTSEDFDQVAYRKFLESQGVFNLGYWKREMTDQHFGSQCAYGELWEVEDGVVLPVESVILDQPLDCPVQGALDSWEGYYQYRGLRLDSPVAILLQWPLTLYHIIANCLHKDYATSTSDMALVIDILGVEKEVELLPLFMEAGYLLKDYSLDIRMFGAGISKTVDKKQWSCGNVSIQVHRCLYHKTADKTRKPHMVLGFNAGLSAYASWTKTLMKLKSEKTPAYFTDYCQYSCQCARTAIESLGVGTSPDPVINPFRCPVRKLAEENNMPWYSNGFIYHISYPP